LGRCRPSTEPDLKETDVGLIWLFRFPYTLGRQHIISVLQNFEDRKPTLPQTPHQEHRTRNQDFSDMSYFARTAEVIDFVHACLRYPHPHSA
jgi:hypothetical protein